MTTPLLPPALQRKLDSLPDGPGVYLWKDAEGTVLYVGKAKRLKRRARNYFTADFTDSPKNRLLRKLIADLLTMQDPPNTELRDLARRLTAKSETST